MGTCQWSISARMLYTLSHESCRYLQPGPIAVQKVDHVALVSGYSVPASRPPFYQVYT